MFHIGTFQSLVAGRVSITESCTDKAVRCRSWQVVQSTSLPHVWGNLFTDLYIYYGSFLATGNKVPYSNKIRILCQISKRWK